ncbi:MAG: DNA primase [Alphaproteobacteria bacterium MarineAlpha5_Bin9]|nr:MAG: DNA primase [Alphaproteobacteria bacterium MarineAlpha5_Bin9]|tara:strand:+ start:6859 stop:8610 length:1752 start_codon:yes stop_codon:yes gene_type:complete
MNSDNSELQNIKDRIILSSEIEKKTPIITKGNDKWCLCLFHKEKTPSMKIDDEQGFYYCFGCGAKGDIFNIYTDLYNYNFSDAVSELAQKTGIILNQNNQKKIKKDEKILKILEVATKWFEENLSEKKSNNVSQYLKKRNLSQSTIKNFRIGYSYNNKNSIFNFLKSHSFSEADIIKSNLVKIDKNKKYRDYFYKRLIFPIIDSKSRVIGFGGRSLDNSNPKYLNSPESNFFQKRYILYNLNVAKKYSRIKNNLLICEGYMDVISLYEKGIKSVVAPLGTSLTEQQLNILWKYCKKPTIMFDGDVAGVKASYKIALMSLKYINSNKFLQFINLPTNEDPDSLINKNRKSFLEFLKNPISLINFIFEQVKIAKSLKSTDDKIIFDKFIDDIINMINDKKTKYFYKNEFKSLFFNTLRKNHNQNKGIRVDMSKKNNSLLKKQIYSFIATYINHPSLRDKLTEVINNSDLLDQKCSKLFIKISSKDFISKNSEEVVNEAKDQEFSEILKNCLNSEIYQLFPYSFYKYNSDKAFEEVKESCKNLKSRLLNLEKLNKSLDSFNKNSNSLKWIELKEISKELIEDSNKQ